MVQGGLKSLNGKKKEALLRSMLTDGNVGEDDCDDWKVGETEVHV